MDESLHVFFTILGGGEFITFVLGFSLSVLIVIGLIDNIMD